MNEAERALFGRICAYSFDEGEPELTFAGRLARENGWSARYAARAIDEYKRFAFLALAAGHPVTPSDQVDQVWHLHLTYTRAYWDRFCGQALLAPLHHGPTRGGRQEGDKYRQWYQQTLDSYQRLFGDAPPADIWPDVTVRFEGSDRFQRVDTGRNWVLRKPKLALAKSGLAAGIGLLLCLAVLSLLFLTGTFFDVAASSSARPRVLGAAQTGVLADLAFGGGQNLFVFFIVLGFMAFFTIIVVSLFLSGRCPRCGKAWALKSTGAIKKAEGKSPARREMKCVHCDHRLWVNVPVRSASGCGSGCGSDSGGGDSGCGSDSGCGADSGCGSGCGGGGCGGGCGGGD